MLRMFENTLLRKLVGFNRYEVTGNSDKCILKNLTTYKPHQIIYSYLIHVNEMGETCLTYVGEQKFLQGFGGKI
jgi:hypothetical protein